MTHKTKQRVVGAIRTRTDQIEATPARHKAELLRLAALISYQLRKLTKS